MDNFHPVDTVWQSAIDSGKIEDKKIFYFDTTESTNTVAMELGQAGEPSGSLVIAETQTKGRGRLGKSWLSPPNTGLYFSTILRPRLEPNDLPKITLTAGLAVCQAIERVTELKPQIKWPNDLLLNDKKIGGILAEAGEITNTDNTLVILGIGLNVTTPISAFPDDLKVKTTSLLAATGTTFNRGDILNAILKNIDTQLLALEKGGFKEILREWCLRDATKDRHLTWVATDGKVVSGVSLGPDDNGLLQIKDQDGNIHEILSGDVNLAL